VEQENLPLRNLFWSTVEPFVGNSQFVDHSAGDDGFLDNSRYILGFYAAVPDALRVDDHDRAEFTLVEAAGRVGSNQRAKAAPLEFRFEAIPQGLAPCRVAAASAMARLAGIAADEDMVRERWHVAESLINEDHDKGYDNELGR
jgi:hypothetical protein